MADENEGTVTSEPTTEVKTEVVAEQKPTEPEKPLTMKEVREYIEEENKKTFKGLQRVIAQKDKEIQTLKTTPVNVDTNTDVSAMRAMVEALKASLGEGDPSVIKAEKSLSFTEQKIAEAKWEAQKKTIISEKQATFNKMIEDAGLDPEDPRLIPYEVTLNTAIKVDGDFSVPEKTLNKILKTVKPEKVEESVKPMSQEEIEKRANELAEAKYQKLLKDKGLLKTDTGAVGSGVTNRMYKAKDVEKMSPSEFAQFQKDNGNKSILQLISEGIIKE